MMPCSLHPSCLLLHLLGCGVGESGVSPSGSACRMARAALGDPETAVSGNPNRQQMGSLGSVAPGRTETKPSANKSPPPDKSIASSTRCDAAAKRCNIRIAGLRERPGLSRDICGTEETMISPVLQSRDDACSPRCPRCWKPCPLQLVSRRSVPSSQRSPELTAVVSVITC